MDRFRSTGISLGNVETILAENRRSAVVCDILGYMHRVTSLVAALVLGLVTGGSAGLSSSPVATTIVTGLGILGFAFLGIRGLSLEPFRKVVDDSNPVVLPAGAILALSVGLASGIPLGIFARTHHWLGASPEYVLHRYKGADLRESEILRLLMQSEMACTPNPDGKSTTIAQKNDGLLSSNLSGTTCSTLTEKLAANTLRPVDLYSVDDPVILAIGDIVRFESITRPQLAHLVGALCPQRTH